MDGSQEQRGDSILFFIYINDAYLHDFGVRNADLRKVQKFSMGLEPDKKTKLLFGE